MAVSVMLTYGAVRSEMQQFEYENLFGWKFP